MAELPSDQPARDRFTRDWAVNLAVVANAGSGKTTAISERLAAVALSAEGAEILQRTTVVTYTKKAAAQIGQRARSVLLRRMAEQGRRDAEALARLDRVFFGTIHSFCLLLARRHGSTLGVHLNPTVVDFDDEGTWQEFLEQDPMTFGELSGRQVDTFLRHAALDEIFELAQGLNTATARGLVARRPAPEAPRPTAAAMEEILALVPSRKGAATAALERNQAAVVVWLREFDAGTGRLPFPVPEGTASGIVAHYRRFFAPLKAWMAAAGGVLAGELALRFLAWRQERGIQTYADQIDTALGVLRDHALLDQLRAEGWRVVLDEAQDTDPQQFAVLVEIARPVGAAVGTWPQGGGAPPRPGHFCMVGDAQQGIYSDRADILNFQRHVAAFARGDGGERLDFAVTFRTPRRVVEVLNATLPAAFGPGAVHNLGLPPAEGAPAPLLQVDYEPLVAGPGNAAGAAWGLRLEPSTAPRGPKILDRRLADEVRQLAGRLAAGGPAAVGAAAWGDICILVPRNTWLHIVRVELERAQLKTALQMRRNRNGDNPVYAWLCGLLAVICDPTNRFEWVGVLREVFAVSDAVLAGIMADGAFQWDEPGDYPPEVADALRVVGGFVSRAADEGDTLLSFASDLAAACGLGARALRLDRDGGLADELDRLLALAGELGKDGGGPREWLRELLRGREEFRAAGRPAADAINLITCHSAKGLEWPVVIPVGLNRPISAKPPTGLRMVPGAAPGERRVVLDNDGLDADTVTSMERARLRDVVRLLYVTLTRARRALVIPWTGEDPGKNSFAALWGMDPSGLDQLGPVAPWSPPGPPEPAAPRVREAPPGRAAAPAAPFPRRVLPHQLAGKPLDLPRTALHEASLDLPGPVKDTIDPLEYGIWWHHTLELIPWDADPAALAAYAEDALARGAEQGFGERGREEWDRFLSSAPWPLLRDRRWTRQAEVGIFAPLSPGEWIDGVIDLVLHDPAARELWIVDWKTNRRQAGEADPALLGRLAAEYAPQLRAYGTCAGVFFSKNTVRLWVYSTVAGQWIAVESPAPGGTP